MLASLIGVTALIFVAKGLVLGQVISLLFAVFYGIISFRFHYYGEMITYLCMSAPIAVAAIVSWLRHPFRETAEVEVESLSCKKIVFLFSVSAFVTLSFYFILRALGTENLTVSTFSVGTSFMASALTCFRSPYYALAYAANDLVLIVLWSLAAAVYFPYFSMVLCFAVFLVNDLYGFFNWSRIRRRQHAGTVS